MNMEEEQYFFRCVLSTSYYNFIFILISWSLFHLLHVKREMLKHRKRIILHSLWQIPGNVFSFVKMRYVHNTDIFITQYACVSTCKKKVHNYQSDDDNNIWKWNTQCPRLILNVKKKCFWRVGEALGASCDIPIQGPFSFDHLNNKKKKYFCFVTFFSFWKFEKW